MVTLRQLYTQFGHDPKWTRFATASTTPMVCVYLRKLGDRDITSLSDFDLALQLAMSDQPEDRKVKAKACMQHLLTWAAEHGHTDIPSCTDAEAEHTGTVPAVSSEAKPTRITEGLSPACSSLPKERKPKKVRQGKTKSELKVRQGKMKSEPVEKRRVKHCTRQGDIQIPKPKNDTDTLTMEEWELDTHWRTGNITPDNSSKGWKNGKRVFKDCWRATIQIRGVKYRYRAKTREECKQWLKAVLSKKILPTDNKADWWRMEQHKDEEARIDELIVSAAEEANIVYEYRQTGDTEILYNYCIKALLPHMVYYCAHSLHLGRDRSLTCSRQAVGLILTKIVGGRPVTNITFTCKRMLRTYKNRGDFWYYDKAPEAVKLMVNRIDMSALAELYKVTKDRRI